MLTSDNDENCLIVGKTMNRQEFRRETECSKRIVRYRRDKPRFLEFLEENY